MKKALYPGRIKETHTKKGGYRTMKKTPHQRLYSSFSRIMKRK